MIQVAFGKRIKELRKLVARMKTILRERELKEN